VNSTLKQHNRVVYSTQAIQHIVRQIESLYWNSVKSEALNPSQGLSGVEIGSDLSNHLYAYRVPIITLPISGTDIVLESSRNCPPNTAGTMCHPRTKKGTPATLPWGNDTLLTEYEMIQIQSSIRTTSCIGQQAACTAKAISSVQAARIPP
jgi:Kinetochore complex Fta4 of Sim4 subunit, or CENP-50